MDQEGENVYVLDALHFETLFLTLKDIMPTVQAHHSDTEIKLNMTKLATLCKKFECSKDSFDENAEDLYPEDYQNMLAYIQDFQELLSQSQKNWTNSMKKEFILSSQGQYYLCEEIEEFRDILNSTADSMDTRILKLQNTAFLMAKETRQYDEMDKSDYSYELDKTIGLTAVDLDESNYKSYMRAQEQKKQQEFKECCHIF